MARIALLAATITNGDAVSNDVIGMLGVLQRHGHDARIYSSPWTFDELQVWPPHQVTDFINSLDDILIYHYTVGWDFGLEVLEELPCRKLIKYHNVTPPEFFAGYSAEHERLCRDGRQLQPMVNAGCDLYLSDSEYSLWELLTAGADQSKCLVVPPFHHIDCLHSAEPDFDVLNAYHDGQTNLLMVGRVSPNKGHAALIEAFALYHRHYNQHSRLLLVGKEVGFETYFESLSELVARYGLEKSIIFTGGVSESELKAYYMVANAFVLTSEHEGFCVPLVESMAMKVPIVAYASTAIPGTVGGAGLVWRERNPFLLAESIDFLVKNTDLSESLGLMGWRRYEQLFTNLKIETQFLSAINSLLST
ncbi:MAG: glycosyltransferase family 4 protein [Acidobacteriota bacterium]|nr:glycosyltransferase family 4 protein [Acidobacteriota bacterium]